MSMEKEEKMEAVKKADKTDGLIREIRKGLLRWYDFKQDARALYVGEGHDPLAEELTGRGLQVVCVPFAETYVREWAEKNQDSFDYLVSIADLERSEEPVHILTCWKSLLKKDGHMLLGMNNRLGIRYFCGDRDPYTGRNMDGIENYRKAYVTKADPFRGRMYDREALRTMVAESGIRTFQFYSVLSDLQNPMLIYGENYLPNEDLANRVFPTYNHPDTVFLEEEALYDELKQNGMFHQMANAYLIECSMDDQLSDVNHVTASVERGREDALLTVIHQSGIVEKRAVYPEGEKRIYELDEHGKDLQAHGLKVVEAEVVDGVYRMPYMNAESGQLYLKRLFFSDQDKFFAEMDHFRDLILQSSDIEKADEGDGEGAILRKGYFDLVPLNSFHQDGEFIFYDQEFCLEHYPANVLILRMISSFYHGNIELQKAIPIQNLYIRYGLPEKPLRWYQMEWDFLGKLLNSMDLRPYYEKCRRNAEVVNTNRQRMNYSLTEYQRIFDDIFKGLGARKLILFGSGAFARQFLQMYGRQYPVYAILDNRNDMWGRELEGIPIKSPDILRKMDSDEYKILICIKNYMAVMKQLIDMEIKNFSIYDPAKSYAQKQNIVVSHTGETENSTPSKKYQTGYVAGVFDMFHAGHLNLLRRAKAQCEYLIVGVMPDEMVFNRKKRYPIISAEDRAEIVGACRYVDQAEILPLAYTGIRDAYKMFQFDCQFSGSDHNDHPYWIADKEYLEKQGADLVFFPYTERVSSTMLRETLARGNENETEK